jgi:hypothetical protein
VCCSMIGGESPLSFTSYTVWLRTNYQFEVGNLPHELDMYILHVLFVFCGLAFITLIERSHVGEKAQFVGLAAGLSSKANMLHLFCAMLGWSQETLMGVTSNESHQP